MSKVTVVIPSLANVDGQYLKLCVESLRAAGFDGDITVVTNGGRDANPIAEYKIKGITKHLHTKQQGQNNAVNMGAEAVEGDCQWLFVSNADMYYAPGWDKNLRFDYPCFSPNLVEPVNNAGSAPPFLKADGGLTTEQFVPSLVDHFIATKIGEEKGNVTTGFNLPFFIRRDAWNAIGGYDVKYDPWGSNGDTDLQTKIELAGIQPMRLRDVLVYHFSNKSGTFDGSHQAEWQANWDYYTNKWGFNRDDEPKPDTWMATGMVNRQKNIYHPEWEGKYLDA